MNILQAVKEWNADYTFPKKLKRLKYMVGDEISEENYEEVTKFIEEHNPLEVLLNGDWNPEFQKLTGNAVCKHIRKTVRMLDFEGIDYFKLSEVPYPNNGLIAEYLVKKSDKEWILDEYTFSRVSEFSSRRKVLMEKQEYLDKYEQLRNEQTEAIQKFLNIYIRSPITKIKLKKVERFLTFVKRYENLNDWNAWMTEVDKMYDWSARERQGIKIMVESYMAFIGEVKYKKTNATEKLEGKTKVMSSLQYQLLAYRVFSDDVINEMERWSIAFGSRKITNTWLLVSLLFTTELRLGDLRNLRRPAKFYEEDIAKFQNGLFTDYDADKYCNDLESQYRIISRPPNKTKRFKDAPAQVFIAAKDYRKIIGRLIFLSEMHYRKNRCKGAFLEAASLDVLPMCECFGKDVLMCLDFRPLQTKAVTKAHMDKIEIKADSIFGEGAGHLVNAILRSHSGTVQDYIKITEAYLSDKMNELDTAEAFLELFQRGCISGISVEIVKQIIGEDTWRKLEARTQTALVRSIENTNMEIDKLAKFNNEIAEAVEEKKNLVIEALTDGRSEAWKDVAVSILKGIASGNVSCKDVGCYCSLKAVGKPCILPQKKHGIGCPFELFSPSFMTDIALEIRDNSINFHKAKTKGEKLKYKLYYDQVLEPIYKEFVYLYKQSYKIDYRLYVENIVEGIGELYDFSSIKNE